MEKKEIKKFFDGGCSSQEEESIGRWLAKHATTEEADRLLYAVLQETKPATEDADSAFRRVCSRLGIGSRVSRSRRIGRWAIRAAACLALPLAVLSLYLYGEAQRPGEWLEAYAPYGKTLSVVLPDGSEIIINSGSKLIYPDKFGRDRRQVFISGEGYATIAKDAKRPFVMSAGEVDVRVLGTQFNLKSYAEDSEVEITLVEGNVEMDTKFGERDRTVYMKPGELVKLNKRTGATERFDVQMDSYLPVVCGGGLFFMDKRLDEIAAYLEKRFDVRINIFERSLAEKHFIASFVNGESLDEILASFNTDGTMRIRREDSIINITKQ